ncbi:MAG: histidine phosphatase family protein [Patescibacteria group bacterium]|jgi:probable phosphoglycerate mutase
MNKLFKVKHLNNQYYILRHGQSKANVLGLIVSQPKNALNKFGLTPIGRKQVVKSISRVKLLLNDPIIYSSDFLRTKQTAQIAQKILKVKKITLTPLLRERNFGQLELTSHVNYPKVWVYDRQSPRLHGHGAESVAEVIKRLIKLIGRLEKKYQGRKILLVSHGDPLKILRGVFKGLKNPFVRRIKEIAVAQFIRLSLSSKN